MSPQPVALLSFHRVQSALHCAETPLPALSTPLLRKEAPFSSRSLVSLVAKLHSPPGFLRDSQLQGFAPLTSPLRLPPLLDDTARCSHGLCSPPRSSCAYRSGPPAPCRNRLLAAPTRLPPPHATEMTLADCRQAPESQTRLPRPPPTGLLRCSARTPQGCPWLAHGHSARPSVRRSQ
jgi:hypothetical protein